MHKLRRYIPSANYLFTFEAAARRLSFTSAADELNVTQPAVSKTIRSLEEACGVKLFHRKKPHLVLTPEGEKLFLETQSVFESLYETITAMHRPGTSEVVRVSFSSVFVAMWLLPRLAKFKARWPDVRLRIEESKKDAFDLDREDIDISSRLGYGNWPKQRTWPFLREEIFPICSPCYLAQCDSITKPADLLKYPLLHFDEPYRNRTTWDMWISAQGLRETIPQNIVFTDNLASTQAALLGQGIGLAWRHLVDEHLKAGRLVNPLGATVLHTDKVMYLVSPNSRPVKPETEIFRDWLLEEIRELPHLLP